MAERLQKLIAQSGVASRRAAEELIVDGRVRVNGRIIRELGAKADLHRDRVEVDGKRLVAERPVYYLLHKPREVVTTLVDPEGRDTISDLLRGIPERVFPVGRLDYHTSGALLITNDGELSQALLHPRKLVPKQYIAKMKGHLEVRALDALRNGVVLDDGYRTKKAELFVMREDGDNSWIHITITEGKNRQIHRMGMAIGHPVMRLSRIGFANLTTEGLRPGDYRELYGHEVEKLQKEYVYGAGAPAPTAAQPHLGKAKNKRPPKRGTAASKKPPRAAKKPADATPSFPKNVDARTTRANKPSFTKSVDAKPAGAKTTRAAKPSFTKSVDTKTTRAAKPSFPRTGDAKRPARPTRATATKTTGAQKPRSASATRGAATRGASRQRKSSKS